MLDAVSSIIIRIRFLGRSVTRYRSESKTRWVNRTEIVYDGACRQSLRFAPKQGANYLLQYTYQDQDVCSWSCFEQTPGAGDEMTQTQCSQ
jgi:hypothetical protein